LFAGQNKFTVAFAAEQPDLRNTIELPTLVGQAKHSAQSGESPIGCGNAYLGAWAPAIPALPTCPSKLLDEVFVDLVENSTDERQE
jgi:hypothetical protein